MTELTKEELWAGTELINIETEEGNIYIDFDTSLNLNFSCSPKMFNDNEEYSFTIKNDNLFLYGAVYELYDSIMSARPYKYSTTAPSDVAYSRELLTKDIVCDNVIDIHSEDKEYDKANRLLISRNEESDFIFTLIKGDLTDIRYNNNLVCIKNANSRYNPYNVTFMTMYNKLMSYDMEQEIEKGTARTRER